MPATRGPKDDVYGGAYEGVSVKQIVDAINDHFRRNPDDRTKYQYQPKTFTASGLVSERIGIKRAIEMHASYGLESPRPKEPSGCRILIAKRIGKSFELDGDAASYIIVNEFPFGGMRDELIEKGDYAMRMTLESMKDNYVTAILHLFEGLGFYDCASYNTKHMYICDMRRAHEGPHWNKADADFLPLKLSNRRGQSVTIYVFDTLQDASADVGLQAKITSARDFYGI